MSGRVFPGDASVPNRPIAQSPPEGESAYDQLRRAQRSARFVKELPPAVAEENKQVHLDQRRVTVRQANLLHRHFMATIIDGVHQPFATEHGDDLPDPLSLDYSGLLASGGTSSLKLIPANDFYIARPLQWGVSAKGFGIFQVDVTTAPTKFTLAKCSIEGQEFYANVMWVVGLSSVEDRLPQLGGLLTVRQVVLMIETPPVHSRSAAATQGDQPAGPSLSAKAKRGAVFCNPFGDAAALLAENAADLSALAKQLDADQRRVTVRQANLLHHHFIGTIIDPVRGRLPTEPGNLFFNPVWLHYAGIVSMRQASPLTIASYVDIGAPLRWTVARRSFGVFDIDVTTVKTNLTMAKCSIEGQDFFANVRFVVDGHSVDDKLPQLGDKSVREVLSNIERPLAKSYSPAPPKDEKPTGK